MINLVISHHKITRDFTTLDMSCVAMPPVRLVLFESYNILFSIIHDNPDMILPGLIQSCKANNHYHPISIMPVYATMNIKGLMTYLLIQISYGIQSLV